MRSDHENKHYQTYLEGQSASIIQARRRGRESPSSRLLDIKSPPACLPVHCWFTGCCIITGCCIRTTGCCCTVA